MIKLNNVTACYRKRRVLEGVSLHLGEGEMAAIVGPNGAGKSTLLRVIAGHLPATGSVHLHGLDATQLDPRSRARLLSVVPQEIASDLPLSGADFVLLGRTAFLPRWGAPAHEDLCAVEEAMHWTETWHLRDRPLREMSGGERQRLALALALAPRPKIILLDEPTSHLDLRHRMEIMQVLTKLNQERQTTLLMAVHDLTLASQFFPRVIVMSNGRKVADGRASDVMRPEVLEPAYGCAVRTIQLPDTTAVCVIPEIRLKHV
jgi:iron complex transport system ATP-binding protein